MAYKPIKSTLDTLRANHIGKDGHFDFSTLTGKEWREMDEAIGIQEEIEEAFLTLLERMYAYSFMELDDGESVVRDIHPRVRESLANLQSVLKKHELIYWDYLEEEL